MQNVSNTHIIVQEKKTSQNNAVKHILQLSLTPKYVRLDISGII